MLAVYARSATMNRLLWLNLNVVLYGNTYICMYFYNKLSNDIHGSDHHLVHRTVHVVSE